ncbi:arginine N-succinyltransferase [Porphyrobacter sp. YT40]|uniref:arginine N-succinyltransferase n=1 Tax=Porphyrobacter sp. YT40 TaxID=2547601 RepID=UPI00336C28B1
MPAAPRARICSKPSLSTPEKCEMRCRVRMARADDLGSLLDLAALTGGGMTNLPQHEGAMTAKIAASEKSCAARIDAPVDEFYLFVLEERGSGRIMGTASVHSCIGADLPFFSFRQSRETHVSRSRGHRHSAWVLHLVNDFDGCAEVGGLFLHPEARSGGFGGLLGRSRYLFISQHRVRFGERIIADLRGWTDNGVSPFWDAVGRHFFGGAFHDADHANAVHGNLFVTELLPRHPIYVDLLPLAAQQVIGRPHDNSLPARAMLLKEGFEDGGYVDIFDAGPTLFAPIDRLASIRNAARSDAGTLMLATAPGCALIARGTGQDFTVALKQPL